MCLPENEGVYCVVFRLSELITVKIGKLGVAEFTPGFYFYCGSAKGRSGLKGRIERHLRKESTKFWHIDYLKFHLEPLRVWYEITKNRSECDLVKILRGFENIDYGMMGFGASDCSHHCKSHLLFGASLSNPDDVFEYLVDRLPTINQNLTQSEQIIR